MRHINFHLKKVAKNNLYKQWPIYMPNNLINTNYTDYFTDNSQHNSLDNYLYFRLGSFSMLDDNSNRIDRLNITLDCKKDIWYLFSCKLNNSSCKQGKPINSDNIH